MMCHLCSCREMIAQRGEGNRRILMSFVYYLVYPCDRCCQIESRIM